MALSDLVIRQAKAAGKDYSLADADGLGLMVSPAGGKLWHLRYYWLGKQKRISLGLSFNLVAATRNAANCLP